MVARDETFSKFYSNCKHEKANQAWKSIINEIIGLVIIIFNYQFVVSYNLQWS